MEFVKVKEEVNGKVRIEIEIDQRLWEFLKKFAEWSEIDLHEYIIEGVIFNLEGDFEALKSTEAYIPKIREFREEFQKLRNELDL